MLRSRADEVLLSKQFRHRTPAKERKNCDVSGLLLKDGAISDLKLHWLFEKEVEDNELE